MLQELSLAGIKVGGGLHHHLDVEVAAAPVGALSVCIQNVSPVGARNSWIFDWPAPTVRVTA